MKATKTRNVVHSDHPLANCTPLGDRVVVRRDMPKQTTNGGILLPDSYLKVKLPIGTVVRVGPGKRNSKGNLVPISLEIGDRVVLTNYAGLEIRDPSMPISQEDEFVILREEDILAKL